MAAVQLWCRVRVVGPHGAEMICWVLEGRGAPDLGAVDDVAHLALLAGRLGAGIVLAEVAPALRALLELAGLDVEMEGQTEGGKEPFGVQERQEERHPGKLPI
jgi:hypothetical protein